MPTLLVENISLPPEVEQALDTRTKMGVIGNLNAYTQFQAAEAMRDAAKNPSGMAGAGMGMGAGFAMAQQMGQAMGQGLGGGAAGVAGGGGVGGGGAPPPIPGGAAFFVAVNNQQTGPFDAASIARKIQGGEIRRDTLVWKQGMAQWAPASSVADLSSQFGAIPPPLPKS